MISGTFTSDNESVCIFLNNTIVPVVCANGTFDTPVAPGIVFPGPGDSGLPFTGRFTLGATANFISGTNTLIFEIRNRGVGGIDSNNTPSGLRVEFNSQISIVGPPQPPLQTGNTFYTQNPTLSAFTSCAVQPGRAGYATFISGFQESAGMYLNTTTTYTPTSAILLANPSSANATVSTRVVGDDAHPPVIVDFGHAVSQILVFESLDHYQNTTASGTGTRGWDAYQYNIYGSNDDIHYFLLFDPTSVNGGPDNASGSPPSTPYTLGAWNGQAPTLVNNTLTSGPGTGNGAIGFEAYYDFSVFPAGAGYTGSYRYYAFRTSSFTKGSPGAVDIEEEISAVAEAVPCSSSFVEVCKSSSSISPVTGNFTFKSNPPFPTILGNSITVPVGSCSGAIPVIPGPVTITEQATSGVGLSAVAAAGYNPMTSVLENRLLASDLANGVATVNAVVDAAGDATVETVATFTNQGLPQGAGSLKICKIAGTPSIVGTSFAFTATGPTTSQNYTVQAGPASEGGYCIIDNTTFPIGTSVTVAESTAVPPLYNVTSVVSPGGATGGSSIKATIGTGFTEVTFTNSPIIAHPPFFNGEVSLSNGVYFLQFQDGNPFGYYNYPAASVVYHYDMGFEAYIPGPAADIYFYDFTSGHWWYSSASLFPYIYDFTLKTFIYYFPDTKNPGHYTTNPRSFVNLTTGVFFNM